MNKITDVNIFNNADQELVIVIYRDKFSSMYIIARTSRRMTVQRILDTRFNVAAVNLLGYSRVSAWFVPKPPEVKIVDLYPAPKEQYKILDAKFFPADNKQQIIAVAVADDTNGWAAYIGVMPDAVMPSVATQIIARDGVKMFLSEAVGLFPASTYQHGWVERTYRK